ncbi:MAG: hypothetical protein QXV21_03420 [Candidatus Bathyarchaeia archaeon]
MKRLELAFYCVRTSSCKHKLCITGGETCLFLKAEWETKLKESTLGNNATPNHSPTAAKPQELQNTHVAESNIKHAKPQPSGKPCSLNMESHQKAGVWKK